MERFTIKKNDRRPACRVTIMQGTNVPLDLTGASVTFRMRARGGAVKIAAGACTVITAASGIVEYPWAAGDTDTPGLYDAEFVATLPGALPLTAPADQHIEVKVVANLA
jgi:hypothetical protein